MSMATYVYGKLERERDHQIMLAAMPAQDEWTRRHANAWLNPQDDEAPIVNLIKAWLAYADAHQQRFESGIGDDGFLGWEWEQIGASLRQLLNGDFGRRLDGGSLDRVICQALETEGFNPDIVGDGRA